MLQSSMASRGAPKGPGGYIRITNQCCCLDDGFTPVTIHFSII
ncbi:hypothetical protein HanXRQr2_Chr10g0420411 [Helianthus annuus]|uniref:Uncharacterized protein n=1 Tax=Helianthus annuus TaxID=4232 RepID=A0A9K3HU24_HELAN|nr:hypothetical protein HanXRQr2_Chr10g0420411 [Helianthus annuus]